MPVLRLVERHARHHPDTKWLGNEAKSDSQEVSMLVLILLLIVLLMAGVGFTLHFLWIVAAVLFVLWLAGFVLGRGTGGRHRFYRW